LLEGRQDNKQNDESLEGRNGNKITLKLLGGSDMDEQNINLFMIRYQQRRGYNCVRHVGIWGTEEKLHHS